MANPAASLACGDAWLEMLPAARAGNFGARADGASWTHALVNLQSALAVAGSGDELRVVATERAARQSILACSNMDEPRASAGDWDLNGDRDVDLEDLPSRLGLFGKSW
jgi:hypothetical protein